MSLVSDWSASFKTNREKFNGSWPAKLTAVWLLLVVGSSAINWQSFSGMAPNEWGDFLAGTMSPIAFMWLVFGYLQQGRELKQNTSVLYLQQKALLLQQKELAEQVAATKQLAAHAEQQAEASVEMVELSKAESAARVQAEFNASQPNFVFELINVTQDGDLVFAFNNLGKAAHAISIFADAFEECSYEPTADLLAGERDHFMLLRKIAGTKINDFYIDVAYTDIAGKERAQRYSFKNNNTYFHSSWSKDDYVAI